MDMRDGKGIFNFLPSLPMAHIQMTFLKWLLQNCYWREKMELIFAKFAYVAAHVLPLAWNLHGMC